MNRRDFIKAALAIPAIAALPSPLKAVEELLDGVTYVSRLFMMPEGAAIVETWRKAGGKIWRCLATEARIISLTEEPFCPWVFMPRGTFQRDLLGEELARTCTGQKNSV